MQLVQQCLKRPVLATVLNLVLLLFGVIGLGQLSVREYPNIDPPVVTVSVNYRGAAVEVMESRVAKVLEDGLAGIEGLDVLSSVSRSQRSQVTLRFRLGQDMETATNEVRDRVSRVRNRLPDDIDEPQIQKQEADASPVLFLALSGDSLTPQQITDIAEKQIKNDLQNLNGVAEVQVIAGQRYAMRIWLQPEALAAWRLSLSDIEQAIRRQSLTLPLGTFKTGDRELSLTAETELHRPEEFGQIVIAIRDGRPILLADVAQVELAAEDPTRIVRSNGQSAIAVAIIKQSTANPLEVVDGVLGRLPSLQTRLPEGLKLEVSNDNSVYIRASLANVEHTLIEAVVLVVLIIFVFLRSFRAVLVPLITIPLSLMGVMALMSVLGFSINTLTLLALVLAIGLVVDDAIVVIENLYRHMERGETPLAAAQASLDEIAWPVISMTLTLAAVFIPVGLAGGLTGKLFTEFAWTLAGAVLLSGWVALTLSPVMAAKLLKPPKPAEHSLSYPGYRRVLAFGLRHAWLALILVPLAAGLLYGVFSSLKKELAPIEDQGNLVGIYRAPEGASMEYTSDMARQLEQLYAKVPEIARYFLVIGSPTASQGISFLRLKPWDERERSQKEIADQLREALSAVTGLNVFIQSPLPLGQGSRAQAVNLVLRSDKSYEELDQQANQLLQAARQSQMFVNLDTDLKLSQPEVRLQVDRQRIADLGIDLQLVLQNIESLYAGRVISQFRQGGEEYDLILQLPEARRADEQALSLMTIPTVSGTPVALSSLVQLREQAGPKELNHFAQNRAVILSGSMAPGFALDEGLKFLEQQAQKLLPNETLLDYSGQSREFREADSSLGLIFLLALAFIYLVLAAQFESFKAPLIILFTVPLAMLGAVLALSLMGGTLNIYSQIGLVCLIGLITKHGILLVDFSNQLRARGLPLDQAIIEAAAERIRPILMTTAAMVLGAVPLVLATGAGAESRRQIGLVIVGGLSLGTLLTLLVLPLVYRLFYRTKTR